MKRLLFSVLLLLAAINCLFAQGNYQGKLGYGYSPKGFPFDYSQGLVFFQELANTCDGGVVYGNGNWRDSYDVSGQIPNLHKTITGFQPSPYGYVDMINFGWATYPILYLDVPGNNTNNWSNPQAKTLFLQMLAHAADSLKPTYLFIGNEINFYWEQDSVDYMNWVAFYEQAYDTIKVYSPSTKVGTTFNYEHLAGVGVLNGWNKAHWSALTVFDSSKIDVLGITLYPFFSYATANTVPTGYLDELFNRWGNKAVVIAETGWSADSLLYTPWSVSPQQQTDFVNRLFTIINGRNVEVVNWLFLNYLMEYSTNANKIFCSIAMRDSLGNDRPAYPVWLSYCDTATGIEPRTIVRSSGFGVKIYPNPFSEKIIINMEDLIFKEEKELQLVMYDILGQAVLSSELLTPNSELRRNGLPDGIYFYEIKNRNRIISSGKLVVQ